MWILIYLLAIIPSQFYYFGFWMKQFDNGRGKAQIALKVNRFLRSQSGARGVPLLSVSCRVPSGWFILSPGPCAACPCCLSLLSHSLLLSNHQCPCLSLGECQACRSVTAGRRRGEKRRMSLSHPNLGPQLLGPRGCI